PLRNPSESDELEACYDQISDNDCSDETVCHLESSYVAGELSSLEQGLGAFGSALVAVDNYDGAGSPAVLVSDPSNSRVVLYKVDASELNSVTAYNYLEVGSPKAFTSGTFYANGASDLVVGAPDSYATYLIYGPLTGSSGVPDVTFTSAGVDYGAGSSVAAIHDLDGNGTGELLIGGVDSTNNGRAWLLDAPLVEMSLADCTADEESEDADSDEDAEEDDEDTEDNTDQYRCTELITSTEGDGFATLVASAGDLDADGRDELLVTAPYGDAGAVYLLGGPVSGTVAVDVDATVLTGEIADDEAGTSVSGGADMDGDGYNDLLVGAPNAALGRGEAYLVRGPVSASVALRAADVVFRGAKADGGAGESVAFAGDINGDGNQDIAIGAPNISTVWVVYGPVSGTVDLSDAEITITDDSTATTSSATDPSSVDASGTGLGEALLGLGDVAGSYTNDLYISEPQSGSDAGRVGLLRGMLP
ncbi:MAG TPA: hypothetical protein DFR83_10785, partial [Deltaproteobacteria bacterium]|nr:hypothetical protein [Deltaproteobacteria bacterium]